MIKAILTSEFRAFLLILEKFSLFSLMELAEKNPTTTKSKSLTDKEAFSRKKLGKTPNTSSWGRNSGRASVYVYLVMHVNGNY